MAFVLILKHFSPSFLISKSLGCQRLLRNNALQKSIMGKYALFHS